MHDRRNHAVRSANLATAGLSIYIADVRLWFLRKLESLAPHNKERTSTWYAAIRSVVERLRRWQ